MEVAAGDDVLIIQEYQWVVGDGVELDGNLLHDIVDGVADGAVYLRDAAQRVGVLDAVLLAVGENLGTFGQQAEVFGDGQLTLVAAHRVYPLVKGVEQAGQRLHAH